MVQLVMIVRFFEYISKWQQERIEEYILEAKGQYCLILQFHSGTGLEGG